MPDKPLSRPKSQPPEHQDARPGKQHEMEQQPGVENPAHRGSGKLQGKVAIITGGDSGIGRAVAVAFAKEGANVAIGYLTEDKDADETKRLVEAHGQRCICVKGDIGSAAFCGEFVEQAMAEFGQVDILVNNAAEQHPQQTIADISEEQLERTFRTNIFSMFFMSKMALPCLKEGAAIINTTSVTAYKGNPTLIDYSSTKGAITAFTRSLSLELAPKGIRVNAVAPGPIWTPLIPSTFPPDKVEQFGKDVPMGRPGQPDEVAMAYVFLASQDASYISGQTIHVNGGSVING
jgi:NAD(P)-dependent dehydrogenase (short-subunit alcohol dehydrogenase family)